MAKLQRPNPFGKYCLILGWILGIEVKNFLSTVFFHYSEVLHAVRETSYPGATASGCSTDGTVANARMASLQESGHRGPARRTLMSPDADIAGRGESFSYNAALAAGRGRALNLDGTVWEGRGRWGGGGSRRTVVIPVQSSLGQHRPAIKSRERLPACTRVAQLRVGIDGQATGKSSSASIPAVRNLLAEVKDTKTVPG